MTVALRIFAHLHDTWHRMPVTMFDNLRHSRLPVPALANQSCRIALVYVETHQHHPLAIRRVEECHWSFDRRGALTAATLKRELHQMIDAINAVDPTSRGPVAPRWTPSQDDLQTLTHAVMETWQTPNTLTRKSLASFPR